MGWSEDVHKNRYAHTVSKVRSELLTTNQGARVTSFCKETGFLPILAVAGALYVSSQLRPRRPLRQKLHQLVHRWQIRLQKMSQLFRRRQVNPQAPAPSTSKPPQPTPKAATKGKPTAPAQQARNVGAAASNTSQVYDYYGDRAQSEATASSSTQAALAAQQPQTAEQTKGKKKKKKGGKK